jgi:hypothetical protein
MTDPPLPAIALTGRRRWIGHLQNTQTDCRWRTAFSLCEIKEASDFAKFRPETFSHWPALPATANHEKD